MKKLLIIFLLVLFSTNLSAQEQVDSLKIRHPYSLKTLLKKVNEPYIYQEELDSLSKIYNVDEFYIYKYMPTDSLRCLATRSKDTYLPKKDKL